MNLLSLSLYFSVSLALGVGNYYKIPGNARMLCVYFYCGARAMERASAPPTWASDVTPTWERAAPVGAEATRVRLRPPATPVIVRPPSPGVHASPMAGEPSVETNRSWLHAPLRPRRPPLLQSRSENGTRTCICMVETAHMDWWLKSLVSWDFSAYSVKA